MQNRQVQFRKSWKVIFQPKCPCTDGAVHFVQTVRSMLYYIFSATAEMCSKDDAVTVNVNESQLMFVSLLLDI